MRQHNFLATAVALDASATKVHGADFTSVVHRAGEWATTFFVIEFTRAAGSASKLDVEIQACFDGSTWNALEDLFQVATNEVAVTGTTVRKMVSIDLPAGCPLRLGRIKNNDGANNLTAVQVSIVSAV
jgi:hypothetical protein